MRAGRGRPAGVENRRRQIHEAHHVVHDADTVTTLGEHGAAVPAGEMHVGVSNPHVSQVAAMRSEHAGAAGTAQEIELAPRARRIRVIMDGGSFGFIDGWLMCGSMREAVLAGILEQSPASGKRLDRLDGQQPFRQPFEVGGPDGGPGRGC
jgi:hypothetical protein